MNVTKKTAKILQEALDEWEKSGYLTSSQTHSLKNSIVPLGFDWQRLAKYGFWGALSCILIAVFAILNDKFILAMLLKIFESSPFHKCIALLVLSLCLYGMALLKRHKNPQKIYSNEALFFLGVLTTAGAVYQLHPVFEQGGDSFSILLFISFMIYGLLGVIFQSKLIWIFSLLSLGSLFGTETGYLSGWGSYFIGMNYPLRFVVFGAFLTILSFYLKRITPVKFLFPSTLIMGLLYLFIALWILSIFGNMGSLQEWTIVKQIHLFYWAVLFAFVAILCIYGGIKTENDILKGFGLTFLFINFYTRFFEYFWEPLHKGIFFSILGITLWFLAARAEKIWDFSAADKKKEEF
jgi:hypothetical protein